jgi:ADP-heptose:LPS heptosyltransferase
MRRIIRAQSKRRAVRAASPDNVHQPARIAIVRLSHLGDVVLALPLFHALRRRFPQAEIAWVVQDEFAPLLDGIPGLTRVIRFARRGGWRAWLALRDELAQFAPELAIDAQGNLKSAFALLATGASRRVGLARPDWRERLGASVLTESAAPVALGDEHAMHKTLALCAHFDASFELRRDPALSKRELELGRELVTQHLGSNARRAVVLQVSDPDDVRSWPLEHFERLARELVAQGNDVLCLSGPGEERDGRELAVRLAGDARIRHWVGQRGLRELAAFMTAAASAGARFVGCDSGPMHLAAACGMRVVVLCGPQVHERTGPWPIASSAGSPHVALRAREQPHCAPCFRRECTHPRGPVCMGGIDPHDVAATLLA